MLTTGLWLNDPVLEARRRATIADLEATGLFREVEFLCIGADGIQKLYNQTKNALWEFTFTDRAVVPEIKGVSEAYLGFVSAPTFLSIVSDEDGDIIKSIFYDNVRDWQGGARWRRRVWVRRPGRRGILANRELSLG